MSAHFLKELGFTLTSERGVNDLSGAWKSDPYWLSWGTKFDGTDLVYYLPEVYEALVLFTDKKFDYVPASQKKPAMTASQKKWNMLNLACHAFAHLPSACKMIFLRPLLTTG